MAEIRPIKFSRDLQKNLFPDNAFYKHSRTESGIGPDVEEIQIPQSTTTGTTVRGIRTLPLTVSERTDTKKSYTVEQVSSEEAKLITDENEIVIGVYSKRQDIMEDLSSIINVRAADIAATEWGATVAGNIVLTDGTTSRATTIVGSSGNRKRLTYDNWVAIQEIKNKTNVRTGGKWYGLLTPDQVSDMYLLDKFTEADKAQIINIQNGGIGTLFGFTLMMRWNDAFGHTGVSYDYNSGTPIKNTEGFVGAADSSAAAIFWCDKMVRHAEGNAKTYIQRDHPLYLGTLLSNKVRFGATIDRLDENGVITLIETIA